MYHKCYFKGQQRGTVFLFVWALFLSSPSLAKDTQVYLNEEYDFSFEYPSSWQEQAPTTPNSKVVFVSPPESPHVECSVVIKKIPMLDNLTQKELNISIGQSPPDQEQYKAAFKQGFNNVSIYGVSQGFLGNRVSQMIRAGYTMGNQFFSVRMAKSFSPGLSWGLTCGGEGESFNEAEK